MLSQFRWEPEGRYRCTKSTAIAPFSFSTEHRWIIITPFWLSTDDNIYSMQCSWKFNFAFNAISNRSHTHGMRLVSPSTMTSHVRGIGLSPPRSIGTPSRAWRDDHPAWLINDIHHHVIWYLRMEVGDGEGTYSRSKESGTYTSLYKQEAEWR